jgi:hypothetical protein
MARHKMEIARIPFDKRFQELRDFNFVSVGHGCGAPFSMPH